MAQRPPGSPVPARRRLRRPPIPKQNLSEWYAGGFGKQLTPLEKRDKYRRCFGLNPLPADHPDNDDINDPLGPDDIPMSCWQDVLDAEPVPDHVPGLDLIPPLVPPDHQFASEQEKKEAEFIRCRRLDTIRWAKWMALARRRESGLPTPKLPPPTIKRKVAKPTNPTQSTTPSSGLPGDLPSATESPAKEEGLATPFPTPFPDIDGLPSVYNCDPNQPLPSTFALRRCDLDKLICLKPPDTIPEAGSPNFGP